MKRINPEPYRQFVGEPVSNSDGDRPNLCWLKVSDLRIDDRYQREVLRNGSRNIGKIARSFNWSLFGVVVVAEINDGVFAIVDGQHRTIAAALRGIDEVPCLVISEDVQGQAKAFAAINGATTAMSPLAIFHAKVAAGDAESTKLVELCRENGVEICRYPLPASKMVRGQTLALRALEDALRNYGPTTLAAALRFILGSKGNDQAVLKAPLIKTVCHILDADREILARPSVLTAIAARLDLLEILSSAELDAKRQKRPTQVVLATKMFMAFEGIAH